jgi:hypothetical protein
MSIKGVAQCLSPRDLNINKLRFTSRTWVHDLAAKVHTGDIVLFSSKHGSSFITKFFTQSGVRPPGSPGDLHKPPQMPVCP